MTNINVQINKTQVVMPDAPDIVSGGVNNLQLNFTFSSDWANYTTKQTIFYRDRNAPLMPIEITNNLCIVPADVIYDWGYFYFGVIGKVDDIVHTTEIVKVKVEKGAFSVETAPTPTPNIYQQMLQVFNSKVDTSVYNAKIAEIESDIENKVLTYRVVGNKVNLNGVDQTYTQLYNACVTGDKAIYLRNGDNNNEIYHLHKVEGSAIGNAIVFSATFGNENRQISIYNRGPAGIEIMITLPAIFLTSADVDQTYSPTSANAQSGVAFAEGLNTRVPTGWTKILDDVTTTEEVNFIIQKSLNSTPRATSFLGYIEFIIVIELPANSPKGTVKLTFGFVNSNGVMSSPLYNNLLSTTAPVFPATQNSHKCYIAIHTMIGDFGKITSVSTNNYSSAGYPSNNVASGYDQVVSSGDGAFGFKIIRGENFPTGTTFKFYAR